MWWFKTPWIPYKDHSSLSTKSLVLRVQLPSLSWCMMGYHILNTEFTGYQPPISQSTCNFSVEVWVYDTLYSVLNIFLFYVTARASPGGAVGVERWAGGHHDARVPAVVPPDTLAKVANNPQSFLLQRLGTTTWLAWWSSTLVNERWPLMCQNHLWAGPRHHPGQSGNNCCEYRSG